MCRISPGLTLAEVTPLKEVKLPFPLSSTTQVACVVVVEAMKKTTKSRKPRRVFSHLEAINILQ